MYRNILTVCFLALLAQPAFSETILKEGAKVDLKVLDSLSSVSANEGDAVKMEVVSDVLADDGKTVAIKAGTETKAYVGQISKRHPIGIEGGGLVSIYVKGVKAVNNTTIPLFGTLSSTGLEKRTVGHALLLGFAAAFQSEGNTGKIKPGSILHAFVEHDAPIADAKQPTPEPSGN